MSESEVQLPVGGRFSVVVPSFQQGTFLERTLQSVFAQDCTDVEIIVEDGGSTDGTIEILKRYEGRLRWQSRRDNGQTAAINAGLRKATGEFLCYLNSDDVLYPGALRKVGEYFTGHPGTQVVYGMADFIDDQDGVIGVFPVQAWDYACLLETNFISQPACFYRRSVYERFGPLDETLHYTMDYEYWLRVGASNPFHFLKERLAASRCHGATKTFGRSQHSQTEVVALLSRYHGGRVPARAIASYARHNAAAQLGKGQPGMVEWTRFAFSYWGSLFSLAPKVTRASRHQLLGRIMPPYQNVRQRVKDPVNHLKRDLPKREANRTESSKAGVGQQPPTGACRETEPRAGCD